MACSSLNFFKELVVFVIDSTLESDSLVVINVVIVVVIVKLRVVMMSMDMFILDTMAGVSLNVAI